MVVLIAAVLPSCKPGHEGAEYWDNEREIIALTQRLRLCEYRLGRSTPDNTDELDDLKCRLSENEADMGRLQADKAAVVAEISSFENGSRELDRMDLEQQRLSTRGMKFGIFPSRDGRIFENAIITTVADSGVDFRHEHGAARLRYGALSDQQRSFFCLEKSVAAAAEDRERREALAYEHKIDLELEAVHNRETQATTLDGMSPATRVSRALTPGSFRKPLIGVLSKPAKLIGSASVYPKDRRYIVYRSHRPVYRYVSRHVPACVRTGGGKSSRCASFTNIP